MENRVNKKSGLVIGLSCLGLMLALACALLWLTSSKTAQGRLVINEAVSSNSASLRDERYGSPDWIELYNTSSEEILLEGYSLARVDKMGVQYRFPSGTIGPGEYLLVYCCPDVPVEGEPVYCTGFKLPKSGATLVLAGPNGNTLQELRLPGLKTDISYGRQEDGTYAFYAMPTPGEENAGYSGENIEELTLGSQNLRISEVMPYPRQGDNSWVEVYNTGEEMILLSQYYLSDDPSRPTKEKLPDIRLAPGEYLVLPFSDGEGETALDFKLNRSEEILLLSDAAGARVDSVTWDTGIFAGFSVAMDQEQNPVYFQTPTPGAANDTPVFGREDFTMEEGMSALRINEVLRENTFSLIDQDGDRSPWVELYNAGDTPVTLSHYALSDEPENLLKWQLPEGQLAPGEYLVVFLSGKGIFQGEEWHTGFRLGDQDEALLLSCWADGMIQTAPIAQNSRDNVSFGIGLEGGWQYFGQPTPGAANTAHGFDKLSAVSAIQGVRINEVSAVQQAKSGKHDWVELYNAAEQGVDLTGWHLSDSGQALEREALSGAIEPGGYLVCGKSLSIAAAGETLYLTDAAGQLVDAFATGVQYASLSTGRSPDGMVRQLYQKQTPGAANPDDFLEGYCAQPVFSKAGGYTQEAFTLSMTVSTPGASIYYTLNGETPTQRSTRYAQPIRIDDTTVIRAVAIKEGMADSDEQVATYYFTKHTLPVVCLSITQSDLDYVFGSLERTDQRERSGYVEYYEADGNMGISFPAGFRIAGAGTRQYPQRSINLYLRGGYGRSQVTYPFFGGEGVTCFQSLSLRNMGQDCSSTRLRDAYFGMAVEGMNLDYMRAHFVVAYINGKYWGLYELKENQNEDYVSGKYGVERDLVQFVRGNVHAYTGGSNRDIKEAYAIAKGDTSSDANFQNYLQRVDEAYFTDYLIAQSFFINGDAYNQKYMRTTDGELKWRPVFYDLDLAMTGSPSRTILKSIFFNAQGVETGKPDEFGVRNVVDMSLFCGFYKNAGWRERFAQRYAQVLNTILTEERLLSRFDAMVESVRAEMPRNIARWGKPGSMEAWERNVASLRENLIKRRPYAIKELQSVCGLSGAQVKALFPNG